MSLIAHILLLHHYARDDVNFPLGLYDKQEGQRFAIWPMKIINTSMSIIGRSSHNIFINQKLNKGMTSSLIARLVDVRIS